MMRPVRTFLVGLLLAGGLSGCLRSPSDSRPEAHRDEPARTQAWQHRTTAGAISFSRRFMDAQNVMDKTGDAHWYEGMVGDDCGSCRDYHDWVVGFHRSGGQLHTKGRRVVATFTDPSADPGEYDAVVALQVRRTPVRLIGANGAVSHGRGANETWGLGLKWVSGRWLVEYADNHKS